MMVNNLQNALKSLLGQPLCNGVPLPLGLQSVLLGRYETVKQVNIEGPQVTSSPEVTTPAKPAHPRLSIVDLPCDVLFSISDHLDTPSAYSLALTCRAFYTSGFPQTWTKITREDQGQLLTTLERDPLGHSRYYCQKCNKLHQYDASWAPRSEAELAEKAKGTQCGMRDGFSPSGNSFGFGFHHARLVMNSHFYGPDHGIPLQNICVDHTVHRDAMTVGCATSAKIIEDELFLRRTYTFTVPDAQMDDFYKSRGHRDFRLCEHLPLLRSPSVYHQIIPELQRSKEGGAFAPCVGSTGSCGICLLDYDITVQHHHSHHQSQDGASEGAWTVEIHAFHQLGSCRSPDDWKWARFTERGRTHLFGPNRPNRRGTRFHPGVVKKSWLEGACESGRLREAL